MQKSFVLLILMIILSACSTFSKQTIVEKADKEKASAVKKVTVFFLTRNKVTFGNIVPTSSEPDKWWEVSPTIEKAVRESLASAGKQIESFNVEYEQIAMKSAHPLPAGSDALLFISEKDVSYNESGTFSGIGIFMDKRKMLFQTLIEPVAILEVVAKFRGSESYSRALAARNVGTFGGASGSDVAGVHFHDTLGEFPSEERELLKKALHLRIRVVVNALLSDIGLANPLKITQ